MGTQAGYIFARGAPLETYLFRITYIVGWPGTFGKRRGIDLKYDICSATTNRRRWETRKIFISFRKRVRTENVFSIFFFFSERSRSNESRYFTAPRPRKATT